MRCSRCGKEIPNDSVFCPECGAEQTTEEKTEENEKKIRCPKCGSEIPEDSVFCPECGNSVRENVLQKKIHPQKIIQQAVEQVSTISKKKVELKKRDKIIGAAAGIILLLCVVISGIMVTRKPTINLNDYMTVSIEGYDTVGQASAVFDSEKFQKKYEKKLRKVISKKHIESTYSSATEQFWSTCVSGTLSKDSGISNGDVITYTWSCNKERASSMYGFKLKYQDIEVKAKNLEELQLPLIITATDLDHGRMVHFHRGSIAERVAASCCMPVMFSPVNIDGTNYVDGGLMMNLPVSTLRRVCNKVVAVNVSPIMAQDYKMNIVSIAMRSFHFMFRANTFPEREKCDLLIEPYNLYGYSNTELEKAEEIFGQGYNTANEVLSQLLEEKGKIWK